MAIAGRLAAREPSARTPTANSTRNPGSSFTFSTVQGGWIPPRRIAAKTIPQRTMQPKRAHTSNKCHR